MRLIDADCVVEVAQNAFNQWALAMATQDTNKGGNKVIKRQELCKAVKGIAENAPTIDPETLPVVQQLRAELANCKQELRQIKYCYDIAKNGEKQLRKQNDEITAAWAECAKKLKQVTAERDAAIKSCAKLAEYELTVCEEFCYGDAQHDIPPCEWLVGGKCALREWVKEYA